MITIPEVMWFLICSVAGCLLLRLSADPPPKGSDPLTRVVGGIAGVCLLVMAMVQVARWAS